MTDMAEFADETDLQEARQLAWDHTLAAPVTDYEEEMFVGQVHMHEARENAPAALA